MHKRKILDVLIRAIDELGDRPAHNDGGVEIRHVEGDLTATIRIGPDGELEFFNCHTAAHVRRVNERREASARAFGAEC